MSVVVDIGHGVAIEPRYIDGVLEGIYYEHPCAISPTGRCSGYAPVRGEHAWTLESESPLTLSPSLLCRASYMVNGEPVACGHHGFLRAGAWVPA